MLAAMIGDITAIPFLGDKPFLSGFPSGIVLHHARNYLLAAVLAWSPRWWAWRSRRSCARPKTCGTSSGMDGRSGPGWPRAESRSACCSRSRRGTGSASAVVVAAALPCQLGQDRVGYVGALEHAQGACYAGPQHRADQVTGTEHPWAVRVAQFGEGDIHPPRWGREAGLAHDRRRPVRRHDKCRVVGHGGAVLLTVDGVRPDPGELEAAAESHSLCRQQAGGSLGRLLAGRLQGPGPRMGHGDVVALQKIAYLAAGWWRRRGMPDRTVPGCAAR